MRKIDAEHSSNSSSLLMPLDTEADFCHFVYQIDNRGISQSSFMDDLK